MATTIQQIELPKKARAVDTSGNNNHGQIYSGRGLEFDGVSDHLTVSHTLPSDIYTVSLWAKFDSAGVFYLFDNRDGSNTNGIGVHSVASSGAIGLIIYQSASNVIATDYDLNIDTWYRIVLVKDGADFTLYCNGIEWGADSGNDNSSNGAAITLGARYSLSNFLPGKMSNFQVWDTAWSAADVTYDYLNPESLALNNSGTALTESNLKLWYPMQDGHRGQQSYILDGANTGAGEELVTNGGFDTDLSGWTLIGVNGDNNVTWVDGKARFLYDDAISTSALGISQSSVTAGVNYKITFDIVVADGTLGKLKFYNNTTETSTNLGTGSHTIYFTALGSYIKFYRNSSSVDTDLTIDNISIKPINDKHHATTVFYGDEMWDGANGDVTNWTPFGNNTVEEDDGTLKFTYVDNVSGPYIYLRDAHHLSADLVVGATYELSITTKVNTGSATWRLQHNSYPTYTFSTLTSTDFVTQSVTFIATTVNSHYLFAGSFSAGEIVWVKDISLKEVGVASGWTDADQQLHIPQTALQSYNELAWFDGTSASNGYMDLDTKIATTDNDWSLSFWVIRQDTPETSYFIMGNEGNKFIALNTATDKLHYRDGDGTYHAISDSGIPYNEWTHVVVTATADTSVLAYVNGVAQTANSNMSDTEIVLKKFMIWVSAAHGTLGSINEISYYSDVLTAAEALDLFNDGKAKSALEASGSAGLVGYWRNNGLSEWKDLKGSNDGNTSAGVVETILIPQGVDSTRDAQGFIMNRQKDTSCLNLTWPMYAEINDSDTLDFGTGDFSIECWVKHGYRHTGSAVNTVIALGGDAASASASIISTATVFRFYVGSALVNSTVTLVKDNWYHVVGTRTGTTVRLYVDGVVESGTATSSQNLTNSLSKYVGRDSGSARDYKEAVDGVRLYADALSAGEVLRNYNATKGNHRN